MSNRTGSNRRRAPTLVLRLYVAGDSPNSALARTNLRAFLARDPNRQVDLEIVDVLEDAERALGDRILVTPTLVKVAPSPECRVIGNLRDQAVGASERTRGDDEVRLI